MSDGYWDSIMPAAVAAGSMGMGISMASNLGQTGADAQTQMGTLAGQLAEDTAFQGYGVTTGLGESTVNADGSTSLGVGPETGMQTGAGTLQANAMNNFDAAAVAASANGGNPNFTAANALLGGNAQNAAYGDAMGAMQGGLNGMSAYQQGMMGASQAAMQNSMQSTEGRETDIYNRAMAMQQPGLDQAKAAQQAQEFAQGRSGVRGSQFGGTAEDAAMARAQAGAQNQAAFQAMGQAQQEQMQQANIANAYGAQGLQAGAAQSQIGQGMGALGAQNAQLGQAAGQALGTLGQGQAQLGQGQAGLLSQIGNAQGSLGNAMYQSSFQPMNQQLQAMQVAQGNAGMAQSGQFTGAGYGAQLGMGGIQTDIAAQQAAAELYGNMFGSLMDNSGQIGSGLNEILPWWLGGEKK